jgi:DNA-directed RNA polymerase specialized sigma24 family protein
LRGARKVRDGETPSPDTRDACATQTLPSQFAGTTALCANFWELPLLSFRRKVVNGRPIICYAWPVKATPGTLQGGGASFATTHWSVVARSALPDVPEAANALARLCEIDSPPIYRFIRRRGYAPADAQDLTQSFFAFFLRTKAYARPDPLHGKFRSFLLASVKNFLSDNWDRDQAIKRGGDYQFVSLDQEKAEAFYDAASAPDSTAERLFELRWAKTLTAGALNSLREEIQAEGKRRIRPVADETHALPRNHCSILGNSGTGFPTT